MRLPNSNHAAFWKSQVVEQGGNPTWRNWRQAGGNSLRATFSWCPVPRSCTAHDWAVSLSQHLQYSHHLLLWLTQNCGQEGEGW